MTCGGFWRFGTDLAKSSDAQLLPTRITAPGSRLGRRFGGQQRWSCRGTEQKRERQTPTPSGVSAAGGNGPPGGCRRCSECRPRGSCVHLLLLLPRRLPLHVRLLQPRTGTARGIPAADHARRRRCAGLAVAEELRSVAGNGTTATEPDESSFHAPESADAREPESALAAAAAACVGPLLDCVPVAILPPRSPDRLITRSRGAPARHNPGPDRRRSEARPAQRAHHGEPAANGRGDPHSTVIRHCERGRNRYDLLTISRFR